ncbi:MAG: hypothetical protein QXI58_00905 [Candidatus Micrarchaeia archaeon]
MDLSKIIFKLEVLPELIAGVTKPDRLTILKKIANSMVFYYPWVRFRLEQFETIKCKEHNCFELVPSVNYLYDLQYWYNNGLHPRFSLLKIILELGVRKYSKIKELLTTAADLLTPTCTAEEIKQKLKSIIEEEKKEMKRLKYGFVELKDFLKYIDSTSKNLNTIWPRLSQDDQAEIIRRYFDIICQDEKYKIARKKHEMPRVFDTYVYITKREIRSLKLDTMQIEALIKLNATPKEFVEISKHFYSWTAERALKYIRNEITVQDFLETDDHEIRRLLLRKLNIDEVLQKMTKIAEDEAGAIYELNNSYYLCVECPSTKAKYLLAIPNIIRSPKEAKKWTFGFLKNDDIVWEKET